MDAPIRAAMMPGIDSTPNTITPSGNRLPTPCDSSIQRNCQTIGRAPQRQERFGSMRASANDSTQPAGIPTVKYTPESQASLRPDAPATSAHINAPQPTATSESQ